MTAVQTAGHLSGALGYALLFGLGAFLLVIAVSVRSFVRSTHDFVIAGRRIGLGFGVGSVIAVWTWSMAVLILLRCGVSDVCSVTVLIEPIFDSK